MHFHKLHDCPTCLFKNNAIEGSQQRGIIVHGTHSSTVESNVLWNVRGAGIYIEDGNELYNDLKYNVMLCPNKFQDSNLHGCTIPGTSNRLADTSDVSRELSLLLLVHLDDINFTHRFPYRTIREYFPGQQRTI